MGLKWICVKITCWLISHSHHCHRALEWDPLRWGIFTFRFINSENRFLFRFTSYVHCTIHTQTHVCLHVTLFYWFFGIFSLSLSFNYKGHHYQHVNVYIYKHCHWIVCATYAVAYTEENLSKRIIFRNDIKCWVPLLQGITFFFPTFIL